MGKNSENQQQKEKDSNKLLHQPTDSKEISNQPTSIIKPRDDFEKDLSEKGDSCQPRKSTRGGLKTEAIDEKNNLQLENNEKAESELPACPWEGKVQKITPTAKTAKNKHLTEQQKSKNALNVSTHSLSDNDCYKLNLVLGQKKDGFAKQDGTLWESFVATCSPLAVTDLCTLSNTSEPESLQEIATMEQTLSSQPPPEGEASQDSVFSRPELEQEGKQSSSSSQQESSVVSSLPNLPSHDVHVLTSDVRGRKPMPKQMYTYIAKRKLQHAQGGRNTCLKPPPREQRAQVPHTVPRPPLAVSPEVKTQLVAQPLRPQLVQYPRPPQSSNGVASTTPRLPLLPRAWYGFQSYTYLPFPIPRHFLIPALSPLELPEEFHVKETHGGRKGADKPPDQHTSSTSTGSGGAGQTSGGGGQGSEEGVSGGGGGMSGSGASGGNDGDPPKKPGPTRTKGRDERKEEEEKKDEKKKKEDEEKSTLEDSGYKSPEYSSSQSSQQASARKTEQGALVTQESGAGLGAGAAVIGHYHETDLQGVHITGHYPEFYIRDLWPPHMLMSPSNQHFRWNVSPSISPLHSPSQSPPTSPSASPPPSPSSSPSLSSPPHSPSSSPPPTLPMSVQETQCPIWQSGELVLPAPGQGQPLPCEAHHNEDGEELNEEPDPVPFQYGPMPSQSGLIPFLAPPNEGQSSLALGLESRSIHESDSSGENSRDSG